MPPQGRTFAEAFSNLTEGELPLDTARRLDCTPSWVSHLKVGRYKPSPKFLERMISEYAQEASAEEWYRLAGRPIPAKRRIRTEVAEQPDHPFVQMAQEIADLAASRAAELAAEKVMHRFMSEQTPLPDPPQSGPDILMAGWELLLEYFPDFQPPSYYRGMFVMTPEKARKSLISQEIEIREMYGLPEIDPAHGLFGDRSAYRDYHPPTSPLNVDKDPDE